MLHPTLANPAKSGNETHMTEENRSIERSFPNPLLQSYTFPMPCRRTFGSPFPPMFPSFDRGLVVSKAALR